MNNFCFKCGSPLNGAKFCPNCGHPVDDSASSPAPITPPVNTVPPVAPPKKKNTNVIVATVVIILCVAFVGIVLNAVGNNKNNTNNKKTSSASSSSSDIESKTYSVGESCTLNGITATVKSCEVYNYENRYSPLPEGHIYIRVHVIVENGSTEDVTLGSVNFDCYANNSAIDTSYLVTDDYLSYERLSPGRQIEGCLYYEVPKDAEVELEFYPDWVGKSKTAIFKLEY